ncbi:hypothetical protein [Promicromonospora kroppenstedtii]|uniref:hypothetical protein n=1 Tax=Promicromonospora kroppenstedtii TaxID=440482 RepID=UPI0006858A98|nr:hypothetical protein [Promicromonospora kroppenstedtii]
MTASIRAVYGLGFADLHALLETLDDDEHREAIEADLIALGLRLRHAGTDALAWHELYAVIRHLPRTSAFYRATHPDDHEWSLDALLLAEVADALRVANWQRGGGRRHEYPKPIPRPGVEPESTTYGKGAVSIDEMEAWLAGTM